MKPNFWKLSQGKFSLNDIVRSIEDNLVYVHKNTKAKGGSSKSQAQLFIEAEIGDYFYLTHGNNGIYLLGQFSGPANLFSTYGRGWLDRPFRFIAASITRDKYSGVKKWWAPSDNSTFMPVPEDEVELFEENILIPYFDLRLEDFGIKSA